jgi:hypothetical protein
VTEWTLTFDCASARRLAEFWKVALGYVDAPPPQGWTTWEDWLGDHDVPRTSGTTVRRSRTPHGRRSRIAAMVERLTVAGGTVLAEVGRADRPDHVVMADPEGNEFCVV